MSLFFRIFGPGEWIPPLLNVCLSVISLGFIYHICNRLYGRPAAFAAGMIWTFYPSQTIYNMFALSEPLYSALILGIWVLILRRQKRDLFEKVHVRLFGYAFLLALLMAMVNAVRPIALILLISLGLLLFLLEPLGGRQRTLRKLLFLGILFLLYLSMGKLWNAQMGSRLGESPAQIPGYSLYTGLNKESSGKFNQADSDLLFSYRAEMGADEAQQRMLAHVRERLSAQKAELPSLLYRKFFIFWEEDTAAIYYMRDLVPDVADRDRLTLGSNAFYYVTIFFAAMACLHALRKPKTDSSLLMLFFIGLTLAQLLVEVTGRYHYSGLLPFTILSAGALFPEQAENRKST